MLTVLSLFSLAQIVASTPPTTVIAPPAPPSIQEPSPTQESPPAQDLPPEQELPSIQETPSAIPWPPHPTDVLRPQQIRALPGQLDAVPVFNSNSPELVQNNGILLSTFPQAGMQVPSAHLNFPLQGRFDLFAHHIARGVTLDDLRTLYLGIVVYNPGDRPVTLDILQAVSYLTQDAPFVDLPAYVDNPMGNVYAGPGSRLTNDILRGTRQSQWPAQLIIPPHNISLLANVPIPLRRLSVPTDGTLPPGYLLLPSPPAPATVTTAMSAAGNSGLVAVASMLPPVVKPTPNNRDLPSNGRSLLMHLSSSGPVYLASMAMYAPKTSDGAERVPTLAEWQQLLVSSDLVGPRDRAPTPPTTRAFLRYFYGRVSGVAQGSQWTSKPTDSPTADHLSIPQPGQAISYVLSTVDHNTFGTGQIQSAPMLTRYPDTAYRAHGNYGIQYNISLPLYNPTARTQRVSIMLQTPLQNEQSKNALEFREPPPAQIFFRGTLCLRYTDDLGVPQTRYIHVTQRRGQEGDPLISLRMPKGDRRLVEVQFIYPPDATPPQVLTVQTQDDRSIATNGSN